jgi:16S rRNA (guanine(966)-N(2))-methyltransferase RsmD
VIAGSARGRKLLSPAGSRVRPTADRVKEALFSALASRFGSFAGLSVLDLFAGSGALGIEALSRGASSALFVDSHPASLQLVRKNLDLTGLTGLAEIIRMDVVRAVELLAGRNRRFDIIVADPPYAEKVLAEELLAHIASAALIQADGTIILETGSRIDLIVPENLMLDSRKVYGDTAIWIFTQLPAAG